METMESWWLCGGNERSLVQEYMMVNNDQGGDSKVESGCARGMHPLQEVFKSEPLYCSERNEIKPYTWNINYLKKKKDEILLLIVFLACKTAFF